MNPKDIFEEAGRKKASDVHIVAGHPVLFRIDGVLVEQGKEALTPETAEAFVRAVLGETNWKRFEHDREIDVSFAVEDGVRMRVNCHFERGHVGLVARIIPRDIPSLEDLDIADIAKGLCMLTDGLILFTGPTGAGKSTSLASMIQFINQTRTASIVTLEDPIEFLFPRGKCVIRQRQYGDDFTSFPEALKRVLRQDPNIVMVGEMRDLETIAAALTLAETGHLIFATLHTPNAVQSIDRIVDVFPPHQQHQIRTQLSLSLKAVIAQQLVPAAPRPGSGSAAPRPGSGSASGRIAVREVLINTPAVSNIIRDGRSQELPTVLQTGSESGMRTFEKEAKRLLDEGKITIETFERMRG